MSTNDPLDEFFARERAAIDPQHTSEEHWSSILEQHRRARRPQRWRYVVGAAAAVVAVGALGLALRPGQGDDALPATSSTAPTTSRTTALPSPSVVTVTETVRGTPTTVTIPATSTTVVSTGGPVLQTFDVVSLTNSGNGHRAALGTASCSGSRCSAVVTTEDDGAHWTVASSFPGEVPGPDGPRIIRFAGSEVGWLVGREVRRTTDGGRTWKDYPHAGDHVFGLETDGRDVVVVAGDAPTADGTRELIVSRAPVGATSAKAVGTPIESSGFTGADVVWSRHTAFVLPHGQDGADRARRVDPNALAPVTAAPGGPTVGLAASAGGDGTLFGFGAKGGAAGSMGFEVAASTDGGQSWTDRTADDTKALLLANGDHTAFAATDATHLVAVSGGSSDYHGSMKVSSDGGRTWHQPAAAPPMPDRGWSWVGSPGGGVVYAIPVDPSGPYWWSSDHGEHWRKAVLGR